MPVSFGGGGTMGAGGSNMGQGSPDLDFSEEDLENLASLGISGEKLAALKAQIGRAEGLRYDQTSPQMRGNSRIQTAANPMEFVGQGIEKFRAGRRLNRLDKERKDELSNVQQQRQAMMSRLLANRQQPQPPQPQQAPNMGLPPGMEHLMGGRR